MNEHLDAEKILAANRVLDEHVAATADEMVTMRSLIDDHASIIRQQDRQARQQRILSFVIGVVGLIAMTLGVAGLKVALDVEHNSRQINRTQEAIAVYCAQTNVYNDEAHARFLELFANAQDPARIKQIADVAFPHRNCTVRSGGVVSIDGTTPTTVTP